MPKSSSPSRARLVRVPNERDDYLEAKANANPDNPHNYVATEINDLIDQDYKKNSKKFKAAKTKK